MWNPFRKKPKNAEKSANFGYSGLEILLDGYPESRAGIAVTERTALECSAVLACVRVLANGVSQVPMHLYRKRDKFRAVASGDVRDELVYAEPNEWQTAFEFWQTVMMHLTLTGNAYVYLSRMPDGRLGELLPFPPGSVSIRRDGWDVWYGNRTQDKQWISVPQQDMWHIRWMAWDGVAGLDAVAMARDAIGLSLALDRHGATSFKNGSRLSGILTVAQPLKEEQRRKLRESWTETFGGSTESGKVAVLGADMKWQQLSANNDASQYDESRRYQVEEICRAFGVDPVMIGYSDKAATFASVEQKSIQHVGYTLMPWYKCIEDGANKKLLTRKERRLGYFFKFNQNAMLRGAIADRASFYTQLYSVGALSPNEIRELEDLNPFEGGDEHRVPLNMAPAGQEPAGRQEDASEDE